MVIYKPRKFSIKDKRAERKNRRVHFNRLRRDPKKMVKPLWWLLLLTIIVLAIMFYLNRIA